MKNSTGFETKVACKQLTLIILLPLPFIIVGVWSAVVWFEGDHDFSGSPQNYKLLSAAISICGFSALLLLYAILRWIYSDWVMEKIVATMLIMALFLFLVYLFLSAMLVRPYSWLGIASTLLSINMIPMSALSFWY
jgi:hypothetical protein